jgi:hypothetical protein
VKGVAAPAQHYADGTANVQPVLPAAVANDPGWAARVQLNNTLNPINGTVPSFPLQPGIAAARAVGVPLSVPSPVGAPTPALLPKTANEAGNLLSAVTGVPAHMMAPAVAAPLAAAAAAQSQPVTQGGRSVTPPAAPVSGPMRSYDNGNVQMTPGPISYVGPAPHEIPGTPEHAMGNPGNYTPQEFHSAFAGMPRGAFYKMLATAHARTMQEQAAGTALSMALSPAEQLSPADAQRKAAVGEILRNLYAPMTALPGMGMYNPNGQ